MTGRKRILYTAFDSVPGPKGASTHISYFLRALTGAGYDVTAVTVRDGDQPAQEEYCGAQILRVAVSHLPSFPKRANAFADTVLSQLDATPYDIVHCRSLWDIHRLVGLRLPGKLIYEVNGLPSVELKYRYPAVSESDLPQRLRQQESTVLSAVDAVFCPSQVTKTFLQDLGAPSDRLYVIPNGVDPSLFKPSVGADLANHPTRERPTKLLYVGTFAGWQGLDTLVAALPHLRKRGVRLRLIGKTTGRWRKTLLKQAQRLGVDDLVAIDEPLEYYNIPTAVRQSDICLAPLAYCDRNVVQGCCPIKMLEYMACAKPVVAANLPVVRELVRDGVDALLFEANDPRDLARQVAVLIDDRDLAWRIAQSGRQRALSFTWQRAQQRLLAVYVQLLGE